MVREKIEKIKNCGFASSVVELKLLTDRLVSGRGDGSGIFTVKYQMLYLIDSTGKTSPQELIFELNMAKSNLALIAKKMIAEGLIESTKEKSNKKQIYYVITEKGKKELSIRMKSIENICSNESKEMLNHLSKTINMLKKVK